MSRPALTVIYHARPWREYYCEGFVSTSLADLAAQLRRYGYPNNTRIEVIDARTNRPILIDLEYGYGLADTIGRLISGTANAPNDPRPAHGTAGGWMS